MATHDAQLFEVGKYTLPGGTPGNAFEAPFESSVLDRVGKHFGKDGTPFPALVEHLDREFGTKGIDGQALLDGLNALQASGQVLAAGGRPQSLKLDRGVQRDTPTTRDVPMARDLPDTPTKGPSKDEGRDRPTGRGPIE